MEERKAILEATKHLKNGDVILFPSDTIWGLSCDATNSEAVEKLIELKGRPEHKSFIVLINSDRMINQCIKDMPEVGWDLMDLSTTPLTMVLEGGQFVAPNAINADGSLGVRKVKEGHIFKLLHQFNKPIVSTSANFSGEPTPVLFKDIKDDLKDKVDYIYPFQQVNEPISSPSKIVKVRPNGEVEILRK